MGDGELCAVSVFFFAFFVASRSVKLEGAVARDHDAGKIQDAF